MTDQANSVDYSRPIIVSLVDSDATHLALTGGKGANLARMRSAGLPVPPGFCVTTAVFEELVETLHLGASIDALDSLDPTDTDAIAERSAVIRSTIQEHPLPDGITDKIEGTLDNLAADAVAVRSSATAEDLPTASFAGQHESFLGISTHDVVLDRVRDCLASLFTDRAVAYRLQNDIPHEDVAMAVVTQEMVGADVAGVLFTADPVSGNRHVASIDANYGLGDTVVAGEVSPDNVRVNRRTDEILEYDIGEKDHAIQSNAGDGTAPMEVSEDARTSRALSDNAVRDLVDLSDDVETLLGSPQDVEWALVDDKFVILQSRPITSLYPLPEPAPTDDALHVYFSMGHQQAMPEALPPLVLDFWKTFGNASVRSIQRKPARDIFMEAGHRVFIDLTPLLRNRLLRPRFLEVLRSMSEPGANALEDLLNRRAQAVPQTRSWTSLRAVVAKIWHQRRIAASVAASFLGPILATFVRGPKDPASVTRTVERRGKAVASQLSAPASTAGRVDAVFNELTIGPLFDLVASESFPRLLSGIIAGRILERLYPDTEDELEALGKGFDHEIATAINQELGDLTDLAHTHSEVKTALENGAPLDEIEEVDGGVDFVDAFDEFLIDFGSRAGSEIDLSRPRWKDNPETLLRTIRTSLVQGDVGDHCAHLKVLKQDAEDAAHTLEARASQGSLGPIKRPIVRRLIEVYRGGIQLREHHKHGVSFVFAAIHNILTEAGSTLAADDRLDDTADVWYLRADELRGALRNNDLIEEVTIAKRRRTHRRSSNMTAPALITSEGEIPQGATPEVSGHALTGTPVSSGIVEGPARIVHDPATESIDKGDILIAPSTDVGWTPLFQNAVGLVMEVGGQMTHGALVAREYGIPAVVSVANATTEIQQGERILIDGTRGTVELLDRTKNTDEHSDGDGSD
ncbi:PEP/pyruvate-binding domain-containing protein [Haladaptatus halobius]|uniref:PEP/pyruvate-binding domain-containing protein n=1 Tax=Haladaptatus halobius TaxID=2884875 RepID=UPI001D0BCDC5|nr:PEP/pyruvate-binding domain-containing protein [Haladaptatus halobius]